MFTYDATAVTRKIEPPPSVASPSLHPSLALASGIARRHAVLIAATGVGCALLAFGASKLVTPRYVATAQIYVDPSAMQQGGDVQPIAPGQDSNGFVNYVESQVLIATSRSVLERVVKSENLEHDSEFSPPTGSAFLGGGSGEDALSASVRALGANLQVRRPERTFVLDLSISSRDPARAAELANATARAYIDEVNAMHSDAAHQTGAAIAGRLESLRATVLEAEKSVEDYKAANGLVGTRDTLLVEQQLKDMNDQIVAAREKMSDAHARAEQIEIARRKGGNVGAIASQLNLTTLAPLRAQQAEAQQKYADAAAELGPRHPQVIDAQARVRAADAAVDAELARFAQSQRIDYARAKDLEAALTRQLDDLKRQTNADDQSMIGLRDLERKATAARDVYELFVNRSRDNGEIQQVEPTRTKIISEAAAPKNRAFPPSSLLLSGLGFVFGLGLGFLVAARREGLGPPTPAAPAIAAFRARFATAAPSPRAPGFSPSDFVTATADPPTPPGPRRLTVGASTALRIRSRRQSLERLDLVDLGFPALPADADAQAFEAILQAADFKGRAPSGSGPGFVLVVAGSNDNGDRTSLAINLALTASRRGAVVVLMDAAGRNAKLTRAVRTAARKPVLDGGSIYRTENGVRLALPKAPDAERGRLRPEQMLRHLLDSRQDPADLIVCDGPSANEIDAANVFDHADAIVALDGDPSATLQELADLGFQPTVLVRFDRSDEGLRMSA
jgi:uncharacterized protein involved in exopolysaccharide biosynthesis/Mrp family chromosome partitioning ATPase